MSELCMRRTEGPLEITGGPTILRKKHDCDLKRSINPEKILQIYKTLRNKLEQEKQKKKKKIYRIQGKLSLLSIYVERE